MGGGGALNPRGQLNGILHIVYRLQNNFPGNWKLHSSVLHTVYCHVSETRYRILAAYLKDCSKDCSKKKQKNRFLGLNSPRLSCTQLSPVIKINKKGEFQQGVQWV